MVIGIFTILHYGKTGPTIRCIDSILKLERVEECKIIVLDNGTKGNAYEELKRRYSVEDKVIIYRTEENLGFTRGNNELYKTARGYEPKFIVTLNNDVEIKQKKFIQVLCDLISFNVYSIIGPDIYKPSTHDHQAPLYRSLPSIDFMENNFMRYWRKIIHNSGVSYSELWHYKYSVLMHKIVPAFAVKLYRNFKYTLDEKNLYKNSIENPVLQGSCVIFTQLYIKNEKMAFEPDTNFYFEELLLALKCKTLKYKTLYTPQLKVIHNHAQATRENILDYSEYMLIQAKRMENAYKIYLACINNNPWS